MSPTDPIDVDVVEQLRALGGAELVRELFEHFVAAAATRLAEAEAAFRDGDTERLEASVHSLRSKAGCLGLPRVSRVAAEIEAIAERRELAGIEALLEDLATFLQAACVRLQAELAGD